MKKKVKNLKFTLSVTKEPILRYWAMRATQNGRGYLSSTIRLALEHYILNQSFLEIARLQCPADDVSDYPKTIVFQYGMSATIRSWVDELRQTGISLVEAIRFVLLNSIYIIAPDENEFMINCGIIDTTATPSKNFEQLLMRATEKISKRIREDDSCLPDDSSQTDFFISPGHHLPENRNNENK